jgi:hypothetical protein
MVSKKTSSSPQADSTLTIPVNLSGSSMYRAGPKLRDLKTTDYRFTSAVEFAVMEQTSQPAVLLSEIVRSGF